MTNPIDVEIDPPLPSDARIDFNRKAFAAWGKLPLLATQINVAVAQINAGTAGVAQNAADASAAASAASSHATNASASKNDAAASATAAGNSATAAGNSATAADASKTAAAASATSATTKATEAATSATTATTKASEASGSASTAVSKAGEASASASTASSAATTATTKAGEAAASATTATTKAGEAAASATAAAGSATSADGSKTAAASSATTATNAASAASASAAAAAASAEQAAGGGEPTIIAGTTSQYWRGDKTWQTLDKGAVGLPNVDNTADADKPISTAAATALAAKADLVGGKVPASQLPAIAITDTTVVADQAAMLALTAERGDIAVRSDLNKSFVLGAEPATTLANWIELRTPTDAVLSVAGKTGAVTLVLGDVTGLQGALDARPYVETAANVVTANTTAVAGRSYDCDTSAGAFTLTLPATPAIGTRIGVRDFKRSFATANLTLGRNAQVIEGLAENCLIDKPFRGSLEFRGGTQGWVFI